MPTYEFRCPKGHEFDRFYKTMSASLMELPCPECGAVAVRQLSGGAGLHFKGSGFYLTDYGKNAHRGPQPEKKESAGADSSASKGDAKPGAVKPAPGSGDAGGSAKPKAEGPKQSKPKSE